MSTLEQETQLSPFQRYLRTHFHQDDADLVQLQLEAQAAGLPVMCWKSAPWAVTAAPGSLVRSRPLAGSSVWR